MRFARCRIGLVVLASVVLACLSLRAEEAGRRFAGFDARKPFGIEIGGNMSVDLDASVGVKKTKGSPIIALTLDRKKNLPRIEGLKCCSLEFDATDWKVTELVVKSGPYAGTNAVDAVLADFRALRDLIGEQLKLQPENSVDCATMMTPSGCALTGWVKWRETCNGRENAYQLTALFAPPGKDALPSLVFHATSVRAASETTTPDNLNQATK